MCKFLPASYALLEMLVVHLPSPVKAQRYHVENLYEGPMDDECAEAICSCNQEGPLIFPKWYQPLIKDVFTPLVVFLLELSELVKKFALWALTMYLERNLICS